MYDLSWHTLLGIGASLLLFALIFPYIRSITKGTTRPSAVSWFGWTFLFVITTVAQASKGIDWSLAIPLISAISSAIIAFTALRLGRALWTRADSACIAFAAIAVILWAVTKEPLTAIVLSIIADFSVTIPTIVKTYEDPKSEPCILWILYVIGVALEIIATRQFTIYNLLFPVYTFLASAIIAMLATRKHKISVAER